MSQTLTRWQAVALGLAVFAAVGLGSIGLSRIAAKQGLWAESFEVTAGFPEVHEVSAGTPVRIRGVDAGQVLGVAYPDTDGPQETIAVRLRLDTKFADRLYADASARILSTGLLGAKVIAVDPGTPSAGLLGDRPLKGSIPPDLADAAAKLRDTATEAEQLLRDIRQSNGTLAKLLKDDDLYQDIKGLTADTRSFVKRADKTVTAVEAELPRMRGFVRDGQETLRSIKTGTDAIQRMPLIRNYVENAPALLVRPGHRRERMTYLPDDLFVTGTAVLSDDGQAHLRAAAAHLLRTRTNQSDLVVAAFEDPAAADQSPESALELTKTRSEAVAEFLKEQGVHKTSLWRSNLKVSPLGMGMNPSPVVETSPLAPSRVEVLLFTPQS